MIKKYKWLYFWVVFLWSHPTLNAQSCTPGQLYAVNGSAITTPANQAAAVQQGLYLMNTTTEAVTLRVQNLFAGGAALAEVNAGGTPATSAFGLDIPNNIIWFCNRGIGTVAPNSLPKIFSYNLNNSTYGTTVATFAGISGVQNINKAAYNPADGNIYFHNSGNNHLYKFNPSTPSVAAIDIGVLFEPTVGSTVSSYGGGDIAFDGLGNLTGAFSSANILAIFPGSYNSAGVYLGLAGSGTSTSTITGQKFANLTSAPSSVGFLTDGNFIVGGLNGTSNINTTTGVENDLGSTNFPSSDFASCAAPTPNLVVNKAATINCDPTTSTIIYTITIQNTGSFHAITTKLIDALPSGITLVSGTLNGTAIPGLTATALANGIDVKSPTGLSGQILKGETATIVLNCTASTNGSVLTNQAFVKYTGVESLNLPNDEIVSNDPSTSIANDATVIRSCAIIASGNVFNDINGLSDNTVNGIGTNAGGVNAVLYNTTTGAVSQVVPVNLNGTYALSGLLGMGYTIVLTTANPVIGSTMLPTSILPNNWTSVGENIGTTTGNDGTVNGIIPLGTPTSGLTNVNFGIDERPTANNNTSSTILNPEGSNSAIVPASVFSGTDLNGGIITSITITAFPTGISSITINGNNYTSGTFPSVGITVPATSTGNPTQQILVDPSFTGVGNVVILYQVTDNAGIKSSNTASATIPFNNLCDSSSPNFVDTDSDGNGNVCDIDDDNDGIPDSVEFNEQIKCLDWSGISDSNPNITTPLTLNSNGAGSYSVNYTAVFTKNGVSSTEISSFTAPKGNSSGDVSLGINATSGTGNESEYMQYVINFTKPTMVRISEHVQSFGPFNAADSWRLTAAGGFIIVNSTGINVISNTGSEIRFDPAATANQPFEIRTTQPVTSITLKMWTNNNTNNLSPLKVCAVLPMDTDNDGAPDYLDLDSDNDGCSDAIEGDENILSTQLNADGSINTNLPSPNNGVGNTSGTSLGVPNLVNSGGSADLGSDIGQGSGSSLNNLINACACYNNPNTSTLGIPTNHGITLLKRAGAENGNWPMIRTSAHTVLESNTKGFVITRMTSDPAQTSAANHLNKITNPQEGMMVYDLFSKCLKIYSDAAWSCFSTPACP
ncbi:thrombospondin type 3 repeat-containing protein [Chryseobacterium sp. PBS4-4]|uniref:Thrombospondin type 3 repeat-containing protein n=1 Tax=Chryseobacterium edaphi TaxID=2976532 RepID=A0ABT2W0N3_9FLAO|nr:thrombospondin type 3 repeat-containing protein [Chryseobacterium edaphi]MCU7615807.1 thrombospondin type 3 repeat-containing protein [Chryseobacterium edaphi]